MDREEFIRYLTEEKNASYNTCKAYERDVKHFAEFLNKRDVVDLCDAVNADVVSYLMELKNLGPFQIDGQQKACLHKDILRFFAEEARTERESGRKYQIPQDS